MKNKIAYIIMCIAAALLILTVFSGIFLPYGVLMLVIIALAFLFLKIDGK